MLPDQAIQKYDNSVKDESTAKEPSKKKQKKNHDDEEKEIPNGEDDQVAELAKKNLNITIVGDKEGASILTIKSGDDEPVDQPYDSVVKEYALHVANYFKGKYLDSQK